MKSLHVLAFLMLVAFSNSKTLPKLTEGPFTEELIRHLHKELAPGGHLSTKSPICIMCHQVFDVLRKIPHRNVLKALYAIGTQYCTLKKLQDREVCKGAVDEMTNYILVNAWARYMDPHAACHRIKVFGPSRSCAPVSTRC